MKKGFCTRQYLRYEGLERIMKHTVSTEQSTNNIKTNGKGIKTLHHMTCIFRHIKLGGNQSLQQ